MPTNLYGPGDACATLLDLPRLAGFPPLKKAGGGRISRSPHSGSADSLPLINVGYGEDPTIRELVEVIADAAAFTGAIEWDRGKPDGTPRKLMAGSRIRALGWKPLTTLKEGLRMIVAQQL